MQQQLRATIQTFMVPDHLNPYDDGSVTIPFREANRLFKRFERKGLVDAGKCITVLNKMASRQNEAGDVRSDILFAGLQMLGVLIDRAEWTGMVCIFFPLETLSDS